MGNLHIKVKPIHITQGECKVPQKCMIALAIKQEDPNIIYASVRTNGITITRDIGNGESIRQHYSVPLKAARAIINFDSGEAPKPFSFHSKLIDQVTVSRKKREYEKNKAAKQQVIRKKKKAKGIPVANKRQPRIAGV